jgi:hypothetical protein
MLPGVGARMPVIILIIADFAATNRFASSNERETFLIVHTLGWLKVKMARSVSSREKG